MEDFKTLGKYTIESTLGQGAMGVVYKGFDPHIERTVALKTIRKDAFNPKELEPLLARFKREAQAAGRLTHPSIVTVYEYGEEGNSAFIAMEFVQGRELKDFLDNHERFPLDTILSITNQLLGALAYSHNQGVVHRDIKPGNILVLDDGQIKITDFGIARIESSNLTQFGDVMGTPSYMSPEQFTGQQIDKRSDIFSAGVILYHLLTGEKPFPGNSMPTIMHRVINSDPPRVSELNFQVPPVIDSIIFKALAKNPADRFQSAEEFAAALNNTGLVPIDASATGSYVPLSSIREEATIRLSGDASHSRKGEPGAGTVLYRKGRSWTLTFLVMALLSATGFLVWKIYSENLSADDLKLLAIEKYLDMTTLLGIEKQGIEVQEITQPSKWRPGTGPDGTEPTNKTINDQNPENKDRSNPDRQVVSETVQNTSLSATTPVGQVQPDGSEPSSESERRTPAPGRILKENEW